MLSSAYDNKMVTRPWHYHDYISLFRGRLIIAPSGPQNLVIMEAEVTARLTAATGKSYICVPTIFGTDWTVPPNDMFRAIWEDCARYDWNLARKLAGLLLCDMAIRHPDHWRWHETETSEDHMRKVYFRSPHISKPSSMKFGFITMENISPSI